MILLLLILLGAPSGNTPAKSPPQLTEKQALLLYQTVLNQLKESAHTPPDTPALILHSVQALLKKADSYGELMKPGIYHDFQERFSGRESGVGIDVELYENEVVISSIIPGSPADKSRIPPGATLEKINKRGIDQFEGDIDLIRKTLRVPEGQKVTISYFHNNSFKTITLTSVKLTRFGFKYRQLTPENIALLQIDLFQEHIVEKIVENLKKKRFKKLIIDLRNNPGGYVEEAIKLADLFISKGVIVTYKERHKKKVIHQASSKTPFKNRNLIILMNHESASASEIFSAAMKEHQRAVLIGHKSYGKGSIQTIYALQHQFALKITTALYKTPKGKIINGKGITPHIILPRYTDHSLADIPKRLKSLLGHDHQLYTAFKLFESNLPIFRHHTDTK